MLNCNDFSAKTKKYSSRVSFVKNYFNTFYHIFFYITFNYYLAFSQYAIIFYKTNSDEKKDAIVAPFYFEYLCKFEIFFFSISSNFSPRFFTYLFDMLYSCKFFSICSIPILLPSINISATF